MRLNLRGGAGRAVFAALVLAALVVPQEAMTQAARVTIGTQGGVHAGQMFVAINKSQVLRVDRPFVQVAIGNAAIADVMPITNQSLYVLGKKAGTTNLMLYGANKRLIAVLDLVVTADADGLKSQLHDLMPSEKVEVRAINDSVILSGRVSSAPAAQKVVALAERFAPGHVLNQMSVRGSQQVLLQVRVAEVSRNIGEALHLDPTLKLGNSTRNNFQYQENPIDKSLFFGTAILTLGSPWYSLIENINALEAQGLVKTLAEPNLLALSGDTASFLAGGEFPVPVVQSGTAGTTGGIGTTNVTIPAISVEFKNFGVGLSFTPTVLDDGLINLVVAPEVSEIDFSTQITIGGTRVPGLTVRRASTTVELHDGEGLAIAGLLQNDIHNVISQLPGIGQIPILGAMFRDTNFQRKETELVIIIVPHLVRPVPPSALLSPTDNIVPPSQIDGYIFGRVEGPGSGLTPPAPDAGGGLSGRYGHILQ